MPSLKKTKRGSKIVHLSDDSISLSSPLESWLNEIDVDVERYKNELNNVFKNKKFRYYRIVDKSHLSKDEVVKWLRDIDIWVTSSNVSKSCYGIDASSAAIVDALRLKRLVKNHDVWVLDMCCAPGGKLLATVEAINRLNTYSRWNVVGLDSVKRRLDVCKSMLSKESYDRDKISVTMMCTRSEEFSDLKGESMLNRFDRIILDVECTHEGSLRSVIRTVKYWGIESLENKWNREYASNIISNQKKLLVQAIKLIKPGGFIVYSTCSLDKEQNELLVLEVVNQFDEIKLYPIPVNTCSCCSLNSEERVESWPCKSSMDILMGKCSKDSFYGDEFLKSCKNKDSPVAIRFDPLKGRTDGLFIAIFVRVR